MSITTGLTGSIVQAFSWMLIHSLWQGLLLSLLAGIILMLTRKASAAIRYNLVLTLFAFFLLTAATTFFYEWNNARMQIIQDQLVLTLAGNNKVSASPYSPIINAANINNTHPYYLFSLYNIKDFIKKFSDYFSAHSFLVVMLWFIFFIAKSVSLAGNILYMQRARHYRVYAPADYWKEKIASLCEKLQLKRAVLLLESGYVKVPVVIGYLKPVILVPVGLIAGIPAAQVEAVLLHELAHIRRNDYVVNFLQNFTETLFFFNPGLLWISSLLKEERENCCDDMAIAQTNSKEDFVQALISFKAYSLIASDYAIAFSGQKSTLLNRVMRIVYQENKTLSMKENGIFIAGIVMLLLTAFTVLPVKEAKWVKPSSSMLKDNNSNFDRSLKKSLNETNMAFLESGANKSLTANAPAANMPNTIGLIKEPVADKIADERAMPTPQTEGPADKTPPLKKDSIPPNEDMSKMSGTQLKKLLASEKFDDSKFYSRAALDSGYYDMIRIRLAGRGGMTALRHNAKVAFIINGVIHEESEAANFTQPQIDALNNGSISIGAIVNARNMYPDLDLSKYEAYIAIGNKLNNSAVNPKTSISP